MSTQYPKTIEELPAVEFYAILTPKTVTDSADDRYSSDLWEIESFTDRSKWEAEIKRLSAQTGYYRTPFKAVIMKPVSVRTTISVEVG